MKKLLIISILALGLASCGSSGGDGTTTASGGSGGGTGGTTTPSPATDFTTFFNSVFTQASNSAPADISGANLIDNDANNPAAYNATYGL